MRQIGIITFIAIFLLISCKEENPEYLEDLLFNPIFEIVIEYPDVGTTIYTNSNVEILWNPENLSEQISIVLLNGTGKINIVENITNSGRYNWNVSSAISPGDDYKIAIYRMPEGNLIGRMTGTFSIQPHPFILLTPNGGEHWYTGRTYDITWNQNLSGTGNYVNIELWTNIGYHSTIAANVSAGNEKHQWKIPNDLTPGVFYRIKILLTKDPSINDFTNSYLTIKTAKFEVQFPRNNQILYKGHKYPIFWSRPDGYSYFFTIELYKGTSKISTIQNYFSSQFGVSVFEVNSSLAEGSDYSLKITNNSTSETIWSEGFSIYSGSYLGDITSYEPNDDEGNAKGPLMSRTIYSSYINSSVDVDWFKIDVPKYNYVKFFIGTPSSINYGFQFKLSTGLSPYYTESNTFHFLGGEYKFRIYSSNGTASSSVPYYFILAYD